MTKSLYIKSMGTFNQLFRRAGQPEDDYKVTITDELVTVEYPKRLKESIRWDDINIIKIVNTNQGPWAPDIWLILAGEQSGCVIPQGTKGFEKVYEIVSKYDGFSFDNFIQSMSCTDNAEFLLWTNIK